MLWWGVLGWVGASPALGAEPPPTEIRGTAAASIPRDASGERAAATLQAALEAALESRSDLRRIPLTLSGDGDGELEQTLARARAALEDGRRAFDQMALDEAIARLSQAVSLFQEANAGLRTTQPLVESLALLASALTLQGSAAEGRTTFTELLVIDPAFQLERASKAVRRVFEEALERLRTSPTGKLEVYSTPAHASVYVDGRFEGTTPVQLSDLTAGTHYVRLERPGYRTFGTRVEVSADEPNTTQARLKDLARGPELRDILRRCARQLPEPSMAASLRQLARELSADRLIVVTSAQSGQDATYSAGVFDAGTQQRLAVESRVMAADRPGFYEEVRRFAEVLVELAATADAGAELPTAAGMAGASSPTPDGNPAVQASGPASRTPPEVYVGWTLVGLGGAALGTGIGFGIAALEKHNLFKDTPQTDPNLGDIQDDGRTLSVVADALLIGGGITAAAGIVVLLVSPQRRYSPRDVSGQGASLLPVPTPIAHGATLQWRARF